MIHIRRWIGCTLIVGYIVEFGEVGIGEGGEMPHYKYLIVGGGMTADAAVNGIREADGEGSIGLISAEQNAPYNRPPLSKGLWKGDKAGQHLARDG